MTSNRVRDEREERKRIPWDGEASSSKNDQTLPLALVEGGEEARSERRSVDLDVEDPEEGPKERSYSRYLRGVRDMDELIESLEDNRIAAGNSDVSNTSVPVSTWQRPPKPDGPSPPSHSRAFNTSTEIVRRYNVGDKSANFFDKLSRVNGHCLHAAINVTQNQEFQQVGNTLDAAITGLNYTNTEDTDKSHLTNSNPYVRPRAEAGQQCGRKRGRRSGSDGASRMVI